MSFQVKRLIPILYVRDLDAEVDFYRKLGFRITFQGNEFPDFVALGSGDVEFGVEKKASFDSEKASDVLVWQFEVSSLATVMETAVRERWAIDGPWRYWEDRDRWEMIVETPNGYRLTLEGPPPHAPRGTAHRNRKTPDPPRRRYSCR